MDPSLRGPNPERPQLVTEATVGELLREVDKRLEHPQTVAHGYIEITNLRIDEPNDQATVIRFERTPAEHSRDGSTLFIHVYPLLGARREDHVHWLLYPNDAGGELIKTSPMHITSETLDEAREAQAAGTAEDFFRPIAEHARNNRDFERRLGFSAAYEEEVRDLIDLIKIARRTDEAPRRGGRLAGLLGLLRVKRQLD